MASQKGNWGYFTSINGVMGPYGPLYLLIAGVPGATLLSKFPPILAQSHESCGWVGLLLLARNFTHRDPIGENPPIVDGDDISMVPCFQAPPMVKNLRIFPSEQQNAWNQHLNSNFRWSIPAIHTLYHHLPALKWALLYSTAWLNDHISNVMPLVFGGCGC